MNKNYQQNDNQGNIYNADDMKVNQGEEVNQSHSGSGDNVAGDKNSNSQSQSILENATITNSTISKISQVINYVNNTPIQEWQPEGIPFKFPQSNTLKFVGRIETLRDLHSQLQQSNRVAITAIKGMGGIGKTELAIQYCLLHLLWKSYGGGICWLNAQSQSQQGIISEIIDFARIKLGIQLPEDAKNWTLSQQVDYCWTRWQEKWQNQQILVIVDGVEDYQQIKDYLPPQPSNFKVIITTRLNLDATRILPLTLGVLDEESALDLLRELIGEEKVNQQLTDAREICGRLGCLPLALNLVGRYIRKYRISLAEMLNRLEAEGLNHDALTVDANDFTRTDNLQKGVKAAFNLSWQRLTDESKTLACLLSIFALSPIPQTLREATVKTYNLNPLKSSLEKGTFPYLISLLNRTFHYLSSLFKAIFHHIPSLFKGGKGGSNSLFKGGKGGSNSLFKGGKGGSNSLFKGKERLKGKIKDLEKAGIELEDLHLVQGNENNDYILHTLIREFFQGQLNQHPSHNKMKRSYTKVMVAEAKNIPEIPTLEDIKIFEPLIPHLQEVALHLTEWLKPENQEIAWIFTGLGWFYQGQGLYSLALPWKQQCVTVTKERLGDERPDVATSLNNLASLYQSQGKYAEAEPLYQQALTMRRKLLGDEHPDVATSLNNLAMLYHSQGKYKEAEPLYQQALTMMRKLLGEEHPHVVTFLNNLAGLYDSQGKYAEAEPLCLQALTMRRKLLGDEHPSVATSLNNLALLYYSQGKYAEAEPLYQQALTMRRKLLGDEHPSVATSLNNLATLYKSQGKYAEAEPLYQQALTMMRKLLGDEHPDVAFSLNNLASLYDSQGKYAEAEPLYQQALTMRRKLLGDEHPDVATSLNNLAYLYHYQGKYKKAEPLYLEALSISVRSLGENHPHTVTVYNNFIYFLQEVIEANRVEELSDNEFTHRLLKELRSP